jgi:hypothetical protein
MILVGNVSYTEADGTSIPDFFAALAKSGSVLHRGATPNACDREQVLIITIHAQIIVHSRFENIFQTELVTQGSQFSHGNVQPHLLQEKEMWRKNGLNDPAVEMRINQLLGNSMMRKRWRRTRLATVAADMGALVKKERINVEEQMYGEQATGLTGLEIKCYGVRDEREGWPCIRIFRAVVRWVNRTEVGRDVCGRVV